MKTAIEAMVDFVLLVLLVLVAFSLISMHINEQNARNFHALAVNEVENSNFSDAVANGLQEEAERQGYTLEINTKVINSSPVAEVVLKYGYSIPMLNIINEPQAIRGTAR